MIGSEKYVSFTTFTRSGTPKPLPVWIADLEDGTLLSAFKNRTEIKNNSD